MTRIINRIRQAWYDYAQYRWDRRNGKWGR